MGLWIYTLLHLLVTIWPQIEASTGSTGSLSAWVGRYSALNYDTRRVHHAHTRHVRDTSSAHRTQTPVEVSFYSHGRWFHLRLERDVETISPEAVVEQPAHITEPVHTTHLVHGTLADEGSARVWGSVIGGVFEGVIDSPKHGRFYVERSHKYFPHHNNGAEDSLYRDQGRPPVPSRLSSTYNDSDTPSSSSQPSPFHSVIYHDDDVNDPFTHLRTGHKSGCGVTDEVADWMRSVQDSAVEEDPAEQSSSRGGSDSSNGIYNLDEDEEEEFGEYVNSNLHTSNPSLYNKYRRLYKKLHKEYHNKYSEQANSRAKRSVLSGGVGEDNKGTCTLSIQTDPLLWRYIYQQEKNDSIKTRDEITAMVSQHIKAVNHIYGDVVFHGKYKHKGIRFEVQRIKIDDDLSCRRYGSLANSGADVNKFCKANVDVSNFLNLHSQTNHDDFCLSYVFTFRDFTGGTLGLAWVASPSGASGGICEKYKTYTENLAGYRHTEQRSLNTGIITFLNYNSRVPPKVSQLTLAHEIGHNFGSPHDFPSSCKPGGREGNFIMFSSATSGDRPNNNKFSSCSVGNISQVLDAIAENRRKNCFKATNGTFCGNKIVEEGEECDCGYDDDDCEERCCYPRLVAQGDRDRNASAKMCSRRQNTQCSPSQGPCCNMQSCRFEQDIECHSYTDCTMSSSCNGRMATCPAPLWQKNYRPCNEDTKVCLDGECRGSICLAHKMSECFLTSDKVQDKKKLCEIACQQGNDSRTCQSTSELSHIFPHPVFMRPGAPCNYFQGYCDVFQKCRAVDAEGPLARLKNLLFNETTLNTVAEWITQYWYWVVFLSVAFILVMGVFIKCCAVHTPSSNPRKPPARSLSETLRRPVNTLRRKRHQHGGGGAEALQLQHQQQQQQRGGHQGRGSAAPPHGGGPRDNRGRRVADRFPPSPHPASFATPPAHIPPPSGPSGHRRNSRGGGSSSAPPLPAPNQRSSANLHPVSPPNMVDISTDDPPPPYPGVPSAGPPPSIPSALPPPTRHGYGEGRGHYNRPKAVAGRRPDSDLTRVK